MDSLNALKKTGSTAVQAGKDVVGSVGELFKSAPAAPKATNAAGEALTGVRKAYNTVDMGLKNGVRAVVSPVLRAPATIAVGTAKSTAATAGKAIVWSAERPLVAGLGATRFGLRSIGDFFKGSPKLAWASTAAVAVAGLGLAAKNRAEAKSASYYEQKAAEVQAQQSYMNSVTPQESANLDAGLKQGGTGGANFAEAATQRSGQPTVSAL